MVGITKMKVENQKAEKKAFFCTTKELSRLGLEQIPTQFQSHKHLIYSSPATLAFNSPGAEGFGVKRAGLAVPDSIMLIVAPGCCGRNTSLISSMKEYNDPVLLSDDGRDRYCDRKTFEKNSKSSRGNLQCLSEKTVGRYDLHYLCGCPSWNGYGAGVQKGGRTGRDSGQTLLYVCTYKRRPKTTDGTCKAVLIFTA